ncbi:hypothetical protein BDV06DRAFT_193858 [Aspergillus oleicola]
MLCSSLEHTILSTSPRPYTLAPSASRARHPDFPVFSCHDEWRPLPAGQPSVTLREGDPIPTVSTPPASVHTSLWVAAVTVVPTAISCVAILFLTSSALRRPGISL